MSFGLTNVGATFQRGAIAYAFKGLIDKIIEIYQDDLMFFFKNCISHIGCVRRFFIDAKNLESL